MEIDFWPVAVAVAAVILVAATVVAHNWVYDYFGRKDERAQRTPLGDGENQEEPADQRAGRGDAPPG
jgi:Tfp pilus assembly protein PilO